AHVRKEQQAAPEGLQGARLLRPRPQEHDHHHVEGEVAEGVDGDGRRHGEGSSVQQTLGSQVPAWQVSASLHSTPSSHAVPSGLSVSMQKPPWHRPSVHWLPVSHDVPSGAGTTVQAPPMHLVTRQSSVGGPEQAPPSGPGTHVEPLQVWHSGQSAAVPAVAGLPPQCQPPLRIPVPGSDRITVPSSLTVAVPVATKLPMSWSNEYSSVTSPGARPSTLGCVTAAGGSKRTPGGWMVTMKRGCWP